MNVISTTGRASYWNPSLTKKNSRQVSQYHAFARSILKDIFPGYRVYEEVTVPHEKLYLDFYIPLKKLAIEVHGVQHYKFIAHFHGDRRGFTKSQARDERKRSWCSLNDITLVELKYDEQDRWERQIIDRDEPEESGEVAGLPND